MRPGDLVDERFEIERLAGKGGMGRVYRAIDRTTHATVALKVLRGVARREVARFEREIELLSTLAHPGIVRYVASGTTGKAPFFAMQWLEGRTLQDRLESSGVLSIDETLRLLAAMTDALAVAHARGVVHRDLKPSNVFLVDDDLSRATLIDFGVAWSADAPASLTQPGSIVGTPGYLAPEQASGGAARADARADVFALACIAVRCLTGEDPFRGEDAVVRAVRSVVDPSPRVRDVPPWLDTLLTEMLSKDPADRPADATAVRARLEHVGDGGASARAKTTSITPTTTSGGPAARTNVAPLSTTVLGRAHELVQIQGQLAADHLVTLVGAAGAGKTTLARAVARSRIDASPTTSAWFCDLSEARSLGDVVASIARALELPILQGNSTSDALLHLARALASRGDTLLVLDNCEQIVADAARVVVALREAAPAVDVLVTSREPLAVAGERVFTVPPLLADEAAQLFVERAQRVAPAWSPTEEERRTLAELVARLDGLPLAIELAAARIGVMSVGEMIERLSRRFELLAARRRDISPRQRTLRSAIDWSWSLLEPSERSALARTAVFCGGFTLDAAEYVVGSAPDDESPVVDRLHSLCDKSLLRVDRGADGAVRFSHYETVRDYAWEKLREEEGAAREACARHTSFFLRAAAEWTRDDDVRENPAGRRRLISEFENVLAVHQRALQSALADGTREDANAALDALDALARVFHTRGPIGRFLSLSAAALAPALADRADRDRVARVRLHRAFALRIAGDLPSAAKEAEQAVDLARSAHDGALEVRALRLLGTIRQLGSDGDAAKRAHSEAVDVARALGHRPLLARALGDLATDDILVGDLVAGCAAMREAAALSRELGDDRACAGQLGNLGVALQELGDFEGARRSLEESLALYTRILDARLQAVVRGVLGTVLFEMGRVDEARENLEIAVESLRAIGERYFGSAHAAMLGVVLATQGDLSAAERSFEWALRTATALGGARLALVEAHRGHLDRASSEACAKRGDVSGSLRHWRAAEKRLVALEAIAHPNDDLRLARRLLCKALRIDPSGVRPSQAEAEFVVAADGAWFRVPGGARVDARRGALPSFLRLLAARRVASPGDVVSVEDLVAAGWPGQRMKPEAGANRVRVALTTLRRLGLRPILLSREGGYLLDDATPIGIGDPT